MASLDVTIKQNAENKIIQNPHRQKSLFNATLYNSLGLRGRGEVQK